MRRDLGRSSMWWVTILGISLACAAWVMAQQSGPGGGPDTGVEAPDGSVLGAGAKKGGGLGPPPDNNDCEDRSPLTNDGVDFDTSFSTTDGPAHPHDIHSV